MKFSRVGNNKAMEILLWKTYYTLLCKIMNNIVAVQGEMSAVLSDRIATGLCGLSSPLEAPEHLSFSSTGLASPS